MAKATKPDETKPVTTPETTPPAAAPPADPATEADTRIEDELRARIASLEEDLAAAVALIDADDLVPVVLTKAWFNGTQMLPEGEVIAEVRLSPRCPGLSTLGSLLERFKAKAGN